MGVLKATFKIGGTTIKQTYTGAFIRVVIHDSSGITVNKYPIYNVSGTVTYCVLTDDATATDFQILNSVLLPALGSRYVDQKGNVYNGVFYKDNTARYIAPVGNGYLWEVTYNVSGDFSNVEPPEDSETILTFSASIELQDEARAVDLRGDYNANSIGLFFDDPLIIKRGILNLNYQRREYSNPINKITNYTNHINSAEIWGFPAGTVLCSSISASITMTETETAYDVSYALQYNPNSWHIAKANSSYYVLGANGYTRAMNYDGSPAETPRFIALNGAELPGGTAPLWRTFQVYPYADLNELDLPDPFLM